MGSLPLVQGLTHAGQVLYRSATPHPIFVFEAGSHVAQAALISCVDEEDLELLILLSLYAGCSDNRHVLLCLGYLCFVFVCWYVLRRGLELRGLPASAPQVLEFKD